jgi:formate hydrogenlyase subunit 6/NADH:ubiquinone oxidoreductase subunit I/CBS domain-containing protein
MSMLASVLKNLASKPNTRRYPAVPAPLPPDGRGRIVYDMSKCIFCGLCERRCPTQAISMDKANKKQSVFRAKCIACGVCVESCPTDCIEMRPEYSPPSAAPEVHVYDAKLTTHQFTVASLPSFQRAKVPKVEILAEPEMIPVAAQPPPEPEPGKMTLDSPVKMFMTSPVLTLFETDPVRKALDLMLAKDVSGIPVVDINLKVLGIISGADVARFAGREDEGLLSFLIPREAKKADKARDEKLRKTLNLPVYEVMSSPAVTATEDATLGNIAALIDENRISRVPIVDANGRLVGIITRGDVLKAISGTASKTA